MNFIDLPLSIPVKSSLTESKFFETTLVQSEAIPVILSGRDVLVQAHTGSGKTIAFAAPILSKVNPSSTVQAIVVVPTRELAIQVANEFRKCSVKFNGIRVLAVYGGTKVTENAQMLRKGAQIVVGTPGRLNDLFKYGYLDADKCNFLVLDEVDRLFEMGFAESVKKLSKRVFEQSDKNVQLTCFSATTNEDMKKLVLELAPDYQFIRVGTSDNPNSAELRQKYFIVSKRKKFDLLCTLLSSYSPPKAMVFVRTKQEADLLARRLAAVKFKAQSFHGDKPQEKREEILKEFKKGTGNILVSTDITARGIDVQGVTHVFNFSLPDDNLFFAHRVGRTARAGEKGTSITLVTEGEKSRLTQLQKEFSSVFEQGKLPPEFHKATFSDRALLNDTELGKAIKRDEKQRYRALALRSIQGDIDREKKFQKKYNLSMRLPKGKKVTRGMRMRYKKNR